MDDESLLDKGELIPDPLLPNIVNDLTNLLNKAKKIREGDSFLGMDCFGILENNKIKPCHKVGETPIDKKVWMWPYVRGFYSGLFIFVHKKIVTNKFADKYFNNFFSIAKVLENIIKSLPYRIKIDLEKEKYNQNTDCFSFLFIVSQGNPNRFKEWLEFRGLPKLGGNGAPWILETESAWGSRRWRLECDPLVAMEAMIAGLLLIIENYFPDSVHLPDLSPTSNDHPPPASQGESQSNPLDHFPWNKIKIQAGIRPCLEAYLRGEPTFQPLEAYKDDPAALARLVRKVIESAAIKGKRVFVPFPNRWPIGRIKGKNYVVTFDGPEKPKKPGPKPRKNKGK